MATSRGCLFWGCSVCCIIILVLGAGVAYAIWKTGQIINQALENEPRPLQVVSLSPNEIESVQSKFEDFKFSLDNEEALKTQAKNPTITLTEKELNLLVNHLDPSFQNKVYLDITKNDTIYLQASFQMPDDSPLFAKKYLNVEAEGSAQLSNSEIQLQIKYIRVGNIQLPDYIYQTFKEQIQPDAIQDQELKELIVAVKQFVIKDERVMIEFDRALLLKRLEKMKERARQHTARAIQILPLEQVSV